jgi:inosine/xanthosine triphosphate pyrophosphatase family protein
MHTLIFATNNRHKIAEIQSLVGPEFSTMDSTERLQALISIFQNRMIHSLEANAYGKSCKPYLTLTPTKLL